MDDAPSGPDAAGDDLGQRLSTAVVLFHEAVGRRLGLRALDHRALTLIEREGPLAAGSLVELTGLTPGGVTGLLDRLGALGYITRETDPTDRRRVVVAVHPRARAALADAFGGLGRAMAGLMAGYDDAELAAITEYVTGTIDILHAETRRLSAEKPTGEEPAGEESVEEDPTEDELAEEDPAQEDSVEEEVGRGGAG
ncbi:MarR family transcriptional regulator [Streptomonospora sp. S1-112]|uniref:MarR family transcriptional regulator n=1 Tax=Streptomonospora mangrovi TaxID=2883123 RepID=A0A9X3NS16_9ACTN|nr:MarR family transcriptional regulator [Streptomonospora mangrovi]MDA0567318.1 MarR family transcriptional regulator [Streptomonospora mangrovi]